MVRQTPSYILRIETWKEVATIAMAHVVHEMVCKGDRKTEARELGLNGNTASQVKPLRQTTARPFDTFLLHYGKLALSP
jgi:hypothetical protein